MLELLVSMAILGLILGLVAQYMTSSGQVTTTLSNQTKLQEELRTAGSIISDEVQRALYIFPPCGTYSTVKNPATNTAPAPVIDSTCAEPSAGSVTLKVTWSKFNIIVSGNTTLNPVANNYTWQVGAPSSLGQAVNGAPILAMIVGPRNPTTRCLPTGDSTGCYTFVAYYPILRSNLTGSGGQLEADASNDNHWVLMEYRRNLRKNLLLTSGGSTYVPESNLTNNASLADRIPWGDAGCVNTDPSTALQCTLVDGTGTASIAARYFDPPSVDTALTVQESLSAVPAIRRSESNPNLITRFRTRMLATRDWLNTNPDPGGGKILLDYLKPTDGFQIRFAQNMIDERGVNQVAFSLQLELLRGGKTISVPGRALEFFAVPRNIALQ